MESELLRFLADESCDFSVVRALRTAGFDVEAVSETNARCNDAEIIHQASNQNRILLTEDKDFGWLVYVAGVRSAGVILIRFPAHARQQLAAAILRLVDQHADKLRGAFAVVQPGQIRLSRNGRLNV